MGIHWNGWMRPSKVKRAYTVTKMNGPVGFIAPTNSTKKQDNWRSDENPSRNKPGVKGQNLEKTKETTLLESKSDASNRRSRWLSTKRWHWLNSPWWRPSEITDMASFFTLLFISFIHETTLYIVYRKGVAGNGGVPSEQDDRIRVPTSRP